MAKSNRGVWRLFRGPSCEVCGQWVHPDDRGAVPGHVLCGWCLKDYLEAENRRRR